MGKHAAPPPALDAAAERSRLAGVAGAVVAVLLGTVHVLPGGGGDSGQVVVMAPTGADVLRGVDGSEPMPYVPPQPYEPEEPRQVAGPQPLTMPTAPVSALPAPVITTAGSKTIPGPVLAAYQAAAAAMAQEAPGCHVSWPLIAGIGRIESGHARGGDVDEAGTTRTPIRGPALTGEGDFALIRDSDGGRLDGDTIYDRAVGPMQFLPGTWAGMGRDGNGDGVADPNNVADAALATATYLCAGGGDLNERTDLLAAVFRYNRSWEYVSHVLAWAGVYAQSGPLTDKDKKGDKDKRENDGAKDKDEQAEDEGAGDGQQRPAPTTNAPEPAPRPLPSPGMSPSPSPDPTGSPAPDPSPSTDPDPLPSPPATPGLEPTALSGRVFVDTDADGVHEESDAGVAGATVVIRGTAADGTPVDLTLPVDEAGSYTAPGLAPGTYSVALAVLPEPFRLAQVLTALGPLLDTDAAEIVLEAGTSVVISFLAVPVDPALLSDNG